MESISEASYCSANEADNPRYAQKQTLIQVNSKEHLTKLLETGKPIVVAYHASWCQPGQEMAPMYEKLSQSHRSITFLRVDVDELSDIADEHNVYALPFFQFYKQNQQVALVFGANMESVKDNLKNIEE